MLKDDNDVEHVGHDAIGAVAMDYFKSMFSSSAPSLINETMQDFQSREIDDMNATMRAEYTEEEMKLALSHMHPIKAPGSDGMCPMFFQSY